MGFADAQPILRLLFRAADEMPCSRRGAIYRARMISCHRATPVARSIFGAYIGGGKTIHDGHSPEQ